MGIRIISVGELITAMDHQMRKHQGLWALSTHPGIVTVSIIQNTNHIYNRPRGTLMRSASVTIIRASLPKFSRKGEKL